MFQVDPDFGGVPLSSMLHGVCAFMPSPGMTPLSRNIPAKAFY
jgi:hypothetical protein